MRLEGGFLTVFHVEGRGGGGIEISNLLNAYDILIFCEARDDKVTYLCWPFMWFEALSGLKINLEKSELFPIARVDNAERLAINLGFKVGSLPTT